MGYKIGMRIIRIGLLLLIAFLVFAFTGCMERLAYMPMRGTPAPDSDSIEEVWFESPEGLRLHGWFFHVPDGPDISLESDAAPPTILVAHGNAGNVSHHAGFVEFLARDGFQVLLFDYRSYGNSDRGRLRRQYLYRDTQAALDYLMQRPDVDPTRLGVYGQSLGGVFASRLAAAHPEIRAVVIVSAFSSWQEIAASAVGGAEPGGFSRWLARMLMPAGLDPIDSLTGLTDGRPVLLVHGTDDEVVPYAHGLRLRDAALRAGVNLTFRSVVGGDHNSLQRIDPTLDQTITSFLRSAFAD
ncbi:MAG: alpha/beta fold hydrolase [Planctomycetes bacterium]|nr:alpha/beta fold hydrolase [Planctomycetota bacterium]NOG53669.1 alpha/beta fold hydrolase [Planctomycetota bacterium]